MTGLQGEQLKDREVYAIIEMVEDRGWPIFEARMQRRLNAMKKSLLTDATRARKEKLPDDYLRGGIEALEWVLAWPTGVAEQRHALEDEDSAIRNRRRAADLLARLGPTFPGAAEGLPEV